MDVQPLVEQRDVALRLGRIADGRCQHAAIAQQNEGFLFERVGLVGIGERAELPARLDPRCRYAGPRWRFASTRMAVHLTG
jgi:hypothetical protein